MRLTLPNPEAVRNHTRRVAEAAVVGATVFTIDGCDKDAARVIFGWMQVHMAAMWEKVQAEK